MKPILAALLFAAPLLAACSQASKAAAKAAPASAPTCIGSDPVALAPATVVATVNGTPITAADLDGKLAPELRKAHNDYVQKVHDMRTQGLEGMIEDRLIDAASRKAKMAPDAWVHSQVDPMIKPPSDAEVQAFYNQHQAQIHAPLDQVKPRIEQFLQQQQVHGAMDRFVAQLKKSAQITLSLPAPALPRVQVAATGPSRGAAKAKVTIVEFSDFQCPFCGRAEETVKQVLAHYGDQVRIVYRNFPLPFHPFAEKAAEAGQCALDQGKFWPMHDEMFAHQDQLTVPDLKKAARALGMDGDRFDQCLDSGAKVAAIKADQQAGEAAGVDGTPAFFIDGQMLSGAQPFDRFQQLIDQALASRSEK